MKHILATLIFLTTMASAEDLESLDLLNNRLIISVPKGTKNEARSQSIMAAPEANESETRLVFEDGEKKLVVMAWELFRRAGANYKEEAPKALKQWSESETTPFKISTIGEHITLGIPDEPNADDDAILYSAAFLHHEDGTIQRVAVYFNPEFHKTPDHCAELAKKIVESIKAGKRSLDLKAGERHLDVLNEGFQMTVSVPEGWTYTTQQGVDFLVHNLQKVSDFGSPSASIGVYIGGHPGYHHSRIDEDTLIKGTRKATLFGEPREWFEYSTKDSEGWKGLEIITGIPGIDDYWKTHIFTGGADDKQRDQLLKIISTAKIEKRAEQDGGGQPATRTESK
jgi:hypothetical protein